MNSFKKLKLALIISAITSPAAFADSCSTAGGVGKNAPLVFRSDVSIYSAGNISDSAWREVASQMQSHYGNTLAHDTTTGQLDTTIIFNVNVGFTKIDYPMRFYLDFSGSTSIEKAILDQRELDTDKSDPNPCSGPGKPPEQTTPPSSGSGSGSGSGANYAGTYTPPDIGYRPDLYNYGGNTRTGTVTMEEVSAYYSNYYSNNYANYYSNMNSCFYC